MDQSIIPESQISEPQPVSEGVWLVQAPLNGVLVCLYILHGKKLAILDTGYSYHPKEFLSPALNVLGFRLSDVDIVLNTHGHPDHLGGNASLIKEANVDVYLSSVEVHLARGPEPHFHSPYDHISAMQKLGWKNEIEQRIDYLSSRIGANARVSHPIRGNELIDLGSGIQLQVIHTPGHSPGSVSYFLIRDKVAFTGDAIQGWGSQQGILPLYFDPRDYLNSLRRLASWDLQTLCLGHPFLWSDFSKNSSPIRRDHDVYQTLMDSEMFVKTLSRVIEQSRIKSEPLEEKVRKIAGLLEEPFQVPVDNIGHIPASSAATIISHLEKPINI